MIISPSENFAKARGAGRHAWCGLLLAIAPGFGQFYHRQWLKGAIFLGAAGQFYGHILRFSAGRIVGVIHLGRRSPAR